jgi:hypothetical protein
MRGKKGLKLKKTLFIFCEWETEKCYFEALKELKRANLNIKIESFNLWQIWTTKNKLEANRDTIYSKIDHDFNYTKTQLKGTNSNIYILLDADAYSKANINTINSFFSWDNYISVLFSNSNIELFILLHLENYTWTSTNCTRLIQKHYPDYEKWCCSNRRKIHKDIIENWQDILKTSILNLNKIHLGKTHIKDKLPYSEVFKIYDNL